MNVSIYILIGGPLILHYNYGRAHTLLCKCIPWAYAHTELWTKQWKVDLYSQKISCDVKWDVRPTFGKRSLQALQRCVDSTNTLSFEQEMSCSLSAEFPEEVNPGNQFKFNTHRKTELNRECLQHVDIDEVVSQNDVGVLQKYLRTMVSCNLDGERCHMCMTPIDVNLLKLFRLAQLSVEWYHYCQESLIFYFNQFKEKYNKLKVKVTKLKVRMKNADSWCKMLTLD